MKSVFFSNGKPYNFNTLLHNWHEDTHTLMEDLGTIAVNFFQDRFRKSSWLDTQQKKWPARKTVSESDRRNKKRALLVKTGRLRNSIHLSAATRTTATITASAHYAAVHNFGYTGIVYVKPHGRRQFYHASYSSIKTRRRGSRKAAMPQRIHVRGHTRKMNMPQRQFMGNSRALNHKCNTHIKNILKNLHKQ